MAKQRKLKPGYAALNKNLCNYPLARDPRVQAHWRLSTKTRRWLCDLLGDGRIQFRLPGNAGKRRGPSGFDMQVLFLLLREARVRDTAELEFGSLASLLKALGAYVDSYNRRRLQEALDLWSLLSISYREWYEPKSKSANAFARSCRLPSAALSGAVCVTITKEWREIAKRFYAQVSLPLPPHAAAQNLVLCLATSGSNFDDETGTDYKWKRSVRGLCEKLGLNHTTRGRVLDHAIGLAELWYAEREGLKLNVVRKDGEIIFYLTAMEESVEHQSTRSASVLRATHEPKRREVDVDDDYDDDDQEMSDNVFDEDGNPVPDDGVA